MWTLALVAVAAYVAFVIGQITGKMQAAREIIEHENRPRTVPPSCESPKGNQTIIAANEIGDGFKQFGHRLGPISGA